MVRRRRGNLYVTDSAAGVVWRIDRDGAVTPWLAHPLLQGTGAFGLGFPIGANGIPYDNRTMWIANSEQGFLVRVPVNPDGSAGSPVLVAADAALFGIDGIALAVHGRVYGAVNVQNTCVRIDPTSGAFATIADAADGLDFPGRPCRTWSGDVSRYVTLEVASFGPRRPGEPRRLAGPCSVRRYPVGSELTQHKGLVATHTVGQRPGAIWRPSISPASPSKR